MHNTGEEEYAQTERETLEDLWKGPLKSLAKQWFESVIREITQARKEPLNDSRQENFLELIGTGDNLYFQRLE